MVWKRVAYCFGDRSYERPEIGVFYMYNKCFFLSIFRFINARRRIVQPMIDQSNRAGESHDTFRSHMTL